MCYFIRCSTMKHSHDHQSIFNHLTHYVAIWQGLGFLLLICLVWAGEIWDLHNALFDEPPSEVNWVGACMLTAAIITVGLIIGAHTYVQQKNVLKGFVIVCSYCRKVHVENTQWEQLERYVSKHTLAEFSHGICPSCLDKAMEDLEPGETPPDDS